MRKLPIILAALALFVAQPVAGQLGSFNPVDYPGVPNSGDKVRYVAHSGQLVAFNGIGYFVGPYVGQVWDPAAGSYVGQPQFTMYCVDFSTYVHTGSSGWTVQVTNAAAWQTSWGTGHQIAFLASLFETNQSKSDWAAIHGAIWTLTNGPAFGYTSSLIEQYLAMAVPDDFQSSDWYMLSSVGDPQSQAFLVRYREPVFATEVHSVPEPGVIVLLLSGLLGVAFVARRRASQFS